MWFQQGGVSEQHDLWLFIDTFQMLFKGQRSVQLYTQICGDGLKLQSGFVHYYVQLADNFAVVKVEH